MLIINRSRHYFVIDCQKPRNINSVSWLSGMTFLVCNCEWSEPVDLCFRINIYDPSIDGKFWSYNSIIGTILTHGRLLHAHASING